MFERNSSGLTIYVVKNSVTQLLPNFHNVNIQRDSEFAQTLYVISYSWSNVLLFFNDIKIPDTSQFYFELSNLTADNSITFNWFSLKFVS